MEISDDKIQEIKSNQTLGGGARFIVYLSPKNDTKNVVTDWSVTFTQGNWSGTITSKNPEETLQTPGLSGLFDLEVLGSVVQDDNKTTDNQSGEKGATSDMEPLKPEKGSTSNIGCNTNCISIVQIVSDKVKDKNVAFYSPTWDAVCS